MTNLQVLILSIIQGITEFLPVSSSGHLILLSKFTSFPDQGLEIDVAVHVGSIIAVMIYFAKDIYAMLVSLVRSKFLPNMQDVSSRLLWLIVIGTIPAVIAGLILHHFGIEELRNTKLIGCTILFYGIVLGVADRYAPKSRDIASMRIRDALLIGFAQCLALIPGTSRSGITITTSRLLGISRREAAKFCMLLSIPSIAGAGLLVAWDVYSSGGASNLHYIFSGIGYSFVASLAAIFVMMRWLKSYSFMPFVVYRVILGLALLLS